MVDWSGKFVPYIPLGKQIPNGVYYHGLLFARSFSGGGILVTGASGVRCAGGINAQKVGWLHAFCLNTCNCIGDLLSRSLANHTAILGSRGKPKARSVSSLGLYRLDQNDFLVALAYLTKGCTFLGSEKSTYIPHHPYLMSLLIPLTIQTYCNFNGIDIVVSKLPAVC